MHSYNISDLLAALSTQFGLRPVIATEIECYLPVGRDWVDVITERFVAEKIPYYRIEAERGQGQYEFSLRHCSDVGMVIRETERAKSLLPEADFSARPFRDQPGSALHLHLHLEDRSGKNVFTKTGNEWDAPYSDLLRYTIGGLLEALPESMLFFAPTEDSYARPRASVSWGTNNRTVAIRLPYKPIDDKHLEHRVSGADADVAQAIFALLVGTHYGLAHRCDPGEAVYGDANLGVYNRPKLPVNLGEARRRFEEGTIIPTYLTALAA